MKYIRNIHQQNAFKHILSWKSFSYLTTLGFFHNYNYIRPGDLFFSNWPRIIKACRFSIKSIVEDFLRSFASVLVLITDKQYLHSEGINDYLNIKFALASVLPGRKNTHLYHSLLDTQPTIV